MKPQIDLLNEKFNKNKKKLRLKLSNSHNLAVLNKAKAKLTSD